MRPIPRSLLDLARARQGLLTSDELSSARYSGRVRAAAVDAGQIVPVHRGVYRLASHTVTLAQRCHAALLAAPDAALSGPTCGLHYQLRRVATDDVHIIATRAIDLTGVHSHRTDFLRPGDIGERFGLRMLRPARLLCDLAWYLDDASLESVFEQMLERRLLTVPLARSMARDFMGRGRPGTRRLAALLDSRSEWLKPVESDLELRLWRALADRGVVLCRQHVVRLDGGGLVRLDLADPLVRFGVEVDHATWHGGRLDVQADKRRDRALARNGWVISRVTDDDIESRLDATCDDLIAIHRLRSA